MKLLVIYAISFIFLMSKLNFVPVFGNHGNETCSLEMFGNDKAAFYACQAEFALQSNWFPSPIAGLFSYLIWNGFDGFWQNGAVLEPMINFMAYTNSTRYLQVIQNSYRSLYSLLEAYGPYPSFDDMGWYGLSYVRIYEVLSDHTFLQGANDIFNWSWTTGWDNGGNCTEGFWFDNLKNGKATITNVEMFQLAAKLYRHTHDPITLYRLSKIYKFIIKNNIVNGTNFLLSNGVTVNCTADNSDGFTYNQGVFIGGLVEMYKIFKDKGYIDLANKVAQATIIEYNNATIDKQVLADHCEPNCDNDAIMFKGIFVRNLRYLMDVLPDKETREMYQAWLDYNVDHVIEYNICDKLPISKCNITFQDGPPYYNVSGPVFSPQWTGPFTYGAPMQQTSALDLFVSAIHVGTLCKGSMCSYDPSYPPPQPLTCGSKPCPQGEECCEYSPYTSYTCCEIKQKCKNGICT